VVIELIGERPALKQLHHDVEPPVRKASAKKDANEVGVIQRDRHPGFALESKNRLLVARELSPQDLDRDVAFDGSLMRAVHRPHAAGTDLFLDAKLLEQDGAEQRVRNLIVGDEQAAIVRAILGAAPELRTAANANLPHVGKLP
jgi:hypothetical protein